jgi:hypothetical protein
MALIKPFVVKHVRQEKNKLEVKGMIRRSVTNMY